MNRSLRSVPLTFLVVASACASEAPSSRRDAPTSGDEVVVAETPTPIETATPTVASALGPNEISRARMRPVLERGLGRFLGAVDVRAVLDHGAFVGFRIVALHAEDGWFDGVDLAPGDVVTRVNGSAIERPEQALAVFRSLDVVSELCVEYLRNGERREIRYAIVE